MTVMEWLLNSDPAIRWQVLRDLSDEPSDVVNSERARVAGEGWGAQLLALQDADGRWDGGTYRPGWVEESKPFFDAWTATHFSLQTLRDFGLDPDSPEARHAISLVRENVRWDVNGAPYFDGEIEPCINGIALAIGAYFGQAVDGVVDRLLDDQLDDAGWNCWAEFGATVASLHTTICVLEGLLAWERSGGSSEAVVAARTKGEEYLLERGLFRARSTKQVIDPRFTMFSFPPGGTTTCSAVSTTSGRPVPPSTNDVPRRSIWSLANAMMPADGPWRTHTKVRPTWRWKDLTGSPAAGTHCEPCVCWMGQVRADTEPVPSSSVEFRIPLVG